MTLIPYVAEKLLRISFPLGVKGMIPFALFMHTAGGILRWYWEFSGIYYDKIAHMIGGIALGLVIFVSILTVILFTEWGIQKRSVLILTALITFLFGIFWEFEEASIDTVMMTTYSGGLYDSIGDTIGNITGIIICLYIAKRYMDTVPPIRNSPGCSGKASERCWTTSSSSSENFPGTVLRSNNAKRSDRYLF